MKQLTVTVVVLCVLLGTSFTVIRNNNTVPVKKSPWCCTKKITPMEEKKDTAPVSYFPMVNIF